MTKNRKRHGGYKKPGKKKTLEELAQEMNYWRNLFNKDEEKLGYSKATKEKAYFAWARAVRRFWNAARKVK